MLADKLLSRQAVAEVARLWIVADGNVQTLASSATETRHLLTLRSLKRITVGCSHLLLIRHGKTLQSTEMDGAKEAMISGVRLRMPQVQVIASAINAGVKNSR